MHYPDMWLVVDIDIQFIWRMWNTPLKPNFIPSIWYSQHCYFAILSKFQKSRNFQVSRTHAAKKRKWRLVKVVTVNYEKSVINKKWKEIKWWLQRTYSNETRNNKVVLFPVPVGIACVSSVDTFHGVMKQLKVVLL